jgi:hypothetical protein
MFALKTGIEPDEQIAAEATAPEHSVFDFIARECSVRSRRDWNEVKQQREYRVRQQRNYDNDRLLAIAIRDIVRDGIASSNPEAERFVDLIFNIKRKPPTGKLDEYFMLEAADLLYYNPTSEGYPNSARFCLTPFGEQVLCVMGGDKIINSCWERLYYREKCIRLDRTHHPMLRNSRLEDFND